MQVDVTSFGKELQDLFAFRQGGRVRSAADWPRRRAECAAILLETCYGVLPPAPPPPFRQELLIQHGLRFQDDILHRQYRVHPIEGSDFGLTYDLFLPPGGQGPFPVILNGDGCWRYATDEVLRLVARRGYALALFNRCQAMPDRPEPSRASWLERRFPEGRFGAIAGWAWAFHRIVDVLPAVRELDASRIAVVGHSRGGKASLLAGALDERVALVAANGSGSGGGGCWRFNGPRSEPLDKMLTNLDTWFSPDFGAFLGRQDDLPFDQHFLKALCAPRPLLCTEALDDLWANPAGTCLSHRAAREAYRLLGAPETRLGLHFRPGAHAHDSGDWEVLLDFCDLQFFAKPVPRDFLREPFDNLPQAFSWTRP